MLKSQDTHRTATKGEHRQRPGTDIKAQYKYGGKKRKSEGRAHAPKQRRRTVNPIIGRGDGIEGMPEPGFRPEKACPPPERSKENEEGNNHEARVNTHHR